MLRQQDPDLLRFSTAATLVPGKWPIILQEATRLVRRLGERTLLSLHSATHGRIQPLGWGDYESLRNGTALNTLVDDLQCDFWHKSAMRDRIKDLGRKGSVQGPSHLFLLSRHLLRAYHVDLMLR